MYGYGSLVYSYFLGDLGLIVGWFWCRVFGILCGLNWEDVVAGGQGLIWDGFGLKLACTGAAKDLSGTPVRGSHTIAWLGASSGTLLRGFPRNCEAPAQCQPSNFG